jgi:hypothetical protein
MSRITEDLADELAREVIDAAEELGDPNLIDEISKVIGAASQTTQEAFMTAVRVRLSERRARQVLADKLAKARASGEKRERIDLSGRKILNTEDDNAGGH